MSTIKTIAHVALFSVLSFSVTNVAHAGLVQLDQFQVIKNGLTLFEDNFNDGIAPPSSNGVTPSGTCFPGGSAAPCSNTYFVSTGSGFGPEAGGKLTINSANGFIPSGENVLQRAILRSNTLPQGTGTGQSNLGLKADDAIIVNGLFDLAVSGLNDNESFGIRLTDRFDNNGVDTFRTRDNEFINDSVRLVVLYPAGGGARVRFEKTEFTPLLNVLFEEEIFLSYADLLAEQILLTLTTDPDGTGAFNVVGASFTIDGVTTTFGGTTTIYNGLDDYTRAGFFTLVTPAPDVTPVPEPATLALFVFGLAGIGFVRLRRSA